MTVASDCEGGMSAHITEIMQNGICLHCGSNGDDE